ncbi:hypothetical protein SJ05684_c08030 [Sinorhizobium sojae CCBAU 05684]|uniref:Uncharacterized protein n=1 Tax=Sinorhizobium sojae CCBAU 05684 TaxID=716928 RepID=A0A249P8S6_9HYPH|nr:hypothetical protein SJ05684_c08030 [Sinorhizobium sojae CCBAU 05684]
MPGLFRLGKGAAVRPFPMRVDGIFKRILLSDHGQRVPIINTSGPHDEGPYVSAKGAGAALPIAWDQDERYRSMNSPKSSPISSDARRCSPPRSARPIRKSWS